MFKIIKKKFLFVLSTLFFFVFYTCKVDNSGKIFDEIIVSKEHHSFICLFADQGNYNSDDAQDTVFNRLLSSGITEINAKKHMDLSSFRMLFFTHSFLQQRQKDLRIYLMSKETIVFLIIPQYPKD